MAIVIIQFRVLWALILDLMVPAPLWEREPIALTPLRARFENNL
jgi:hypothetical protein